jgi:hypothetical protein
LDYFASGGVVGCPALLVEPSAQNLVLRSEEFNVSGTWSRVSGGTGLLPVVTANAVVAPDGTTTAETIVFDRNSATSGTANFSQIQQVISLATSGTYTISVYAKATTSGDVGKGFYIRAKDNLVSGALTSSWVRYTSTETGVASGNTNVTIGNRGGFTADSSVSVDLWGAQVETGSVATSYIPTTTAAVTRNADVISVSGAVSGSIGQASGTIYAEVDIRNLTDGRILTLLNTSTRYILLSKATNRLGGAVIDTTSSPTTVMILQTASGSLTAGTYKLALAYASGDFAFYVNGTQVGTSSTGGVIGGYTSIRFGNFDTSLFFNDRIRAAALYTERLTNAQLAALTT